MQNRILIVVASLASMVASVSPARTDDALINTKPLTMSGDIAAQIVAGTDKFLLREIDASVERRAAHWKRDTTSAAAYNTSIDSNRQRLAHLIGVRDKRVTFDALELVATTVRPALVGEGDGYKVYAVRWPVLRNVHGEGLWLVPNGKAIANVVALPDADQTPEMICGLSAGVHSTDQFARLLAQNGCNVLVPTLIHRHYAPRNGRAKMTDREYLYRSAYELGRHIIGYEVQKTLAAVDWYLQNANTKSLPTGVMGYGEGGLTALYSAALDSRIDAACVAGYFGSRQRIWEQPISRNVFGLLEQFGDAELASMIVPRPLVIDSSGGPTVTLASEGGAPAKLVPPTKDEVTAEIRRARLLVGPFADAITSMTLTDRTPASAHLNPKSTKTFFRLLTGESQATDQTKTSQLQVKTSKLQVKTPRLQVTAADASSERQERQFRELDDHNAWLLAESASNRREFMNLGSDLSDKRPGKYKIDTSSLEAFAASMEPYRDFFYDEVIGRFDHDLLPMNARSRVVYDRPKWTGHEVVLDVFPDVIAYGILCLPKGLNPNEKRPVVVCQHGLEGHPRDTIEGDHRAYHDFAAKLADRGYIVFAPQNLYVGEDRFRTLQRKAYPIKKTLFSIIVPQHQQIVNWLKTQNHVDADRIAFYGLSYGGKSAMRIPPLVPDYSLSICSADFNEWVKKNATTRENYSYVWTKEYEIFEFDLGNTFNYAEMAALIAPRPFMVERGHFDMVGTDENVAFEFAKVRFLYAARLAIADRCEIEWFVGPHTINGKGTFAFLDRFLSWNQEQ